VTADQPSSLQFTHEYLLCRPLSVRGVCLSLLAKDIWKGAYASCRKRLGQRVR